MDMNLGHRFHGDTTVLTHTLKVQEHFVFGRIQPIADVDTLVRPKGLMVVSNAVDYLYVLN